MKTTYYEILWDTVCLVNVVVLILNNYIMNRHGAAIKTMQTKLENGQGQSHV